MAVELNAETAVKVANDAATEFVEGDHGYYKTLMNFKNSISTFYVPIFDANTGNSQPPPTIVWNGNIIGSGAAMQKFWEDTATPPSKWEIQSFNSHMLNPYYNTTGTAAAHPIESGKNMSILIQVSGYVKFGDTQRGPQRGFSESFVLVPNPEATVEKWGKKGVRNWIIQSQTFRVVV